MSRGRVWKGVIDWLRSRRQVGEDAYHRYYAEFIAKGMPERRYVEYKDGNHVHVSDRMDTEWWSWLHNRRDLPPTQEELTTKQKQQHILAQRVQAIEMEEERRRLRMSLHNRGRHSEDPYTGSSAPDERPKNAAERDVLRRRRTLLRLQQAASSQQVESTTGSDDTPPSPEPDIPSRDDAAQSDPQHSSEPRSPTSRPPAPVIGDATVEDRNVKEEPTVSLV